MSTRTDCLAAGPDAAIDNFIEALWLEEGLSQNTLAAYGRDLRHFARWLQAQEGLALDGAAERHLHGYFSARHAQTRATTAYRQVVDAGVYRIDAVIQRQQCGVCISISPCRARGRQHKARSLVTSVEEGGAAAEASHGLIELIQ